MTDFAVAARILTLAGTELADLDDEAAGYELVSVAMPDEAWRRITTTSPVVDGEFETQAALSAARIECVVRISGDTWAEVEARRLALRDAYTSAPSFLLDVVLEGVSQTWRSYRPDVTGSVDTTDLASTRRLVALTFPVQPNPTISGV